MKQIIMTPTGPAELKPSIIEKINFVLNIIVFISFIITAIWIAANWKQTAAAFQCRETCDVRGMASLGVVMQRDLSGGLHELCQCTDIIEIEQ